MSTFLFILVWVFYILAGIAGLLLYVAFADLDCDDKDNSGCFLILILVIAVIVFLFAAHFIKTTEPIQWSYTKEADNIAAYQMYLNKFPNGSHVQYAQNRLSVLPKENAILRQKIANEFSSKGISDSLGGKILEFFINQPPDETFTITTRYVQPSQWPSDYHYEDLQRSIDYAMKAFADMIRVRVNIEHSTIDNSPPFSHVTVLFKCSGSYCRKYDVEDKSLLDFSNRVKGICVDIKILLYLPNQKVESKAFSINVSPHKRITVPDDNYQEYKKRREIQKNVSDQVESTLRKELGMNVINQ